MNIEETKIEDLHFDPANVRKHDEKNLEAIKSSLLRFGQQKPIVVDGKGIVIAGNGTLTAAKALGWEKEMDHMIKWMAFTIRHPDVKINHMLILGSGEGGGKDWLLYPLMKELKEMVILFLRLERLIKKFPTK